MTLVCNSLEFPVALIIIKKKNLSCFEISEINLFAVQLLNLNNDNIYDTKVFKERASSFKETGLKKEKKNSSTLFDNIMKGNSKCYCSNYINSRDQIIYAKIKETFNKIYIVIDDYDDDRVTVQERLISSIPRQYLITLSHELKNYFCGLITTLEESQIRFKQEELQTVASCVDLIKYIIKLFILYTKVSLDRIHFSSEKITQCMDLYRCLDIMQKKYKTIFNYKSITLNSITSCKGIIIETDSYYFKNLISVLFFYIYYKMPEGTEVNLNVTKLPNSKVSIGFVSSASIPIDKDMSIYRSGTSNVVEDSEKIPENEIKKSVITIQIFEYLIANICKFLNFEFILGGNTSSFPPTEPGEFLTLRMLLSTYTNKNIPVINTSYNTNSIINGSTQPSSYNVKLNEQNNSVHNNTFNEEQNNNGILLFSYEKKNTFEKTKSGNRSMDQGRPSIPAVILPSKTFQKERKDNKKKKTIDNSIKNVSLINAVCGSEGNMAFLQPKKKLSNNQNRKFLCLDDSISHYSRLSEDDESPLNRNFKISQLTVKMKKSTNQLSSFKKNSETSVTQNSTKKTIYTNSSIRNKITQIEKFNKININAIISSSHCECRDIAVVDDEISILNSMINIIKRQNLQCDFFKDGKDVYEKIVTKSKCFCTKKYYKLILLDIYMPEWSGIKTCDMIEELIKKGEIPKKLNVVLISAHKEKDINVPQYEFIKGFYQKPVSKNTVISILQQFYS